MAKRHFKRFNIPKTWKNIFKKENTFIIRPLPGAHEREISMPLGIVLKLLGLATTRKEVRKILNTKNVLVDGRRIKEDKFPIGLFDTITITETGENYRCAMDEKGQLEFKTAKNPELKASRIIGKSKVKKGKTQINLSDSRNILAEKDDYKISDTAIINPKENKITKIIPLKENSKILLIRGKHAGDRGIVEKIDGEKLVYKNKNNESVRTLKNYAFAIPEELI